VLDSSHASLARDRTHLDDIHRGVIPRPTRETGLVGPAEKSGEPGLVGCSDALMRSEICSVENVRHFKSS
jgi:hypothetical protein